MSGPIDGVLAIHNAFRKDIAQIDTAALAAARGQQGLEATVERFRFFDEVLAWHAHGEELAIFPALEGVAPSVAEAYEMDHRALDAAFVVLSEAVSAHDALGTARATAAFKFHLDLHLAKEDRHMFRLIRERLSLAEQSQAVHLMATSAMPPERFPEFVNWVYPLMSDDDRESMTSVYRSDMPAEVFARTGELIAQAIGDDYAELARRIPELPAIG